MATRKKEIIKMREENDKLQFFLNRKKSMKPNVSSLRSSLKICKLLARLIRKKRENTQITNIRNTKINITRDSTNKIINNFITISLTN